MGAGGGGRLGKKALVVGKQNERGRRRGRARHSVLKKRPGVALTFCLPVLTVRQRVRPPWRATCANVVKMKFKLLSSGIYVISILRIRKGRVAIVIMVNM
jgi:hypothetical protein